MASLNTAPTTMEELLRQMNKRLITLERRRNGDGVQTLDGDCVFGGGSGGDTSYYGGGTGPYVGDPTFPNDYPDGSWNTGGGGGGGSYTAGPNIDITGTVIRVSVPFVAPTGADAPPGIFYFDEFA